MTSSTASQLVRRLWHYCNILRDDGLSYPDYVEQLTYLLFLKLADERSVETVPAAYSWQSMRGLKGADLREQYGRILANLANEPGILGLIFQDARNKIRDPKKLERLVVDLIGETEWDALSADVKGDAYEGLLQKNAQDTKSGAGQYFTPRPLVDAIVQCVDPAIDESVCDPACGTGGFLLSAHAHSQSRQSGSQPDRESKLFGVELVPEVARLAAMNLFLHGIGSHSGRLPIACADSLAEASHESFDVVLTNPPFGIKGSIPGIQPTDGTAERPRPDFWVSTSNKQLNFLQHVYTLLMPRGRAAVVIPDNVLFEAGPAAIVRRHLLDHCSVHTLLRLPRGLFYAQGVMANVLFFDRRDRTKSEGEEWVWIYDMRDVRTNYSVRTRPLAASDLSGFTTHFSERARPSGDGVEVRPGEWWHSANLEDVRSSNDCSLDIRPPRAAQRGRTAGDELEDLTTQIEDELRAAIDILADSMRPPRES